MCLFVRIPVSSVSVFVCSSLCVCVLARVFEDCSDGNNGNTGCGKRKKFVHMV